MPTYHYRCSRCEQHLEVVQSMRDDPITECAACGGEMQKVLQPVGIVLKGSGFYRTDSRSGSGSKRTSKTEKSDKTEKTEKTEKSEKSESKGNGKGSSSDSSSSSTSAAKGTEAKSA